MKRDVNLEFFYAHSSEVVWRAITEPELVGKWLMPMHGFEQKVGTRFQFRSKPAPGWNGIVECEVLEVEAPRRLVQDATPLQRVLARAMMLTT